MEELVFIYRAGSQTQNVVLGFAIKLHTVEMVGFCEYVVRKILEYISERPQLKGTWIRYYRMCPADETKLKTGSCVGAYIENQDKLRKGGRGDALWHFKLCILEISWDM